MHFKQHSQKQLIWPNLRFLRTILMAIASGDIHLILVLVGVPQFWAFVPSMQPFLSWTILFVFLFYFSLAIKSQPLFQWTLSKDYPALISTLVLSIYTLRLFSRLLITHLIFNHTLNTTSQFLFYFLFFIFFSFVWLIFWLFICSYLFVFLKNKIDLFFD